MPKTTIGFEFSEIPLEEAINAALAGNGKYAELKEFLINKLPNLPHDKAFAFGLPGGKDMPDTERKGVSMALASTLKKANIPWRVSYSPAKKLFICVPRNIPKRSAPHPSDLVLEFRNKVIALAKDGIGQAEIARRLNAKEGRVRNVYYRYVKGVSK